MNLRKDHYRVPPEGRRRPPSRPSGNGCEKKNRSRRGRGRGRWRLRAAGLADARLPHPETPAGTPRGTRRRAGEAPESRGGGERPLRAALLPSGTRGGTRPPAGRAGYRTGPAALYPGGRRGLGRFGSLEPGRPLARGAPGRAPGRPRPRRGGSRPPGPPSKDPPPSGARKLAESPRGASEETYLEREQRARLLAVDHSARASMKNAASCEN